MGATKADGSKEVCPADDKENCKSCNDADNFVLNGKKCEAKPAAPVQSQQQIVGSLLHKYMSFKTGVTPAVTEILGTDTRSAIYSREMHNSFFNKIRLNILEARPVIGSWFSG